MKTISEAEWEQLKAKERAKWVLYNPSMQDKAVDAVLTAANKGIDGINQMGDFYKTMKTMPSPTPAEELGKFLEPFKSVDTAFEALEKLEIPGIKQITDMFKATVKSIGSVFQMTLLVSRQISLYTDAMVDSWEAIDWNRIEKNLKDLKEGSKESNTPAILSSIEDLDKIDFPNDKIESDVKDLGNETKNCITELEKLQEIKDSYQPVVDAAKPFTWDNFTAQLSSACKMFGLDFDQLEAEVDQTQFHDPTESALKVSEKINNVMKNKTYILKTDMDKLIKKREEREKKNA